MRRLEIVSCLLRAFAFFFCDFPCLLPALLLSWWSFSFILKGRSQGFSPSLLKQKLWGGAQQCLCFNKFSRQWSYTQMFENHRSKPCSLPPFWNPPVLSNMSLDHTTYLSVTVTHHPQGPPIPWRFLFLDPVVCHWSRHDSGWFQNPRGYSSQEPGFALRGPPFLLWAVCHPSFLSHCMATPLAIRCYPDLAFFQSLTGSHSCFTIKYSIWCWPLIYIF